MNAGFVSTFLRAEKDHTGGKITRDSGAKINCITEEQALPESHDYTGNVPS